MNLLPKKCARTNTIKLNKKQWADRFISSLKNLKNE